MSVVTEWKPKTGRIETQTQRLESNVDLEPFLSIDLNVINNVARLCLIVCVQWRRNAFCLQCQWRATVVAEKSKGLEVVTRALG